VTPFPGWLLRILPVIIVGAIAAFTILTALAIAELVRDWRHERAARRQAEEEQAGMDGQIGDVLAMLCTLCNPGGRSPRPGHGRCTCPAYCGDAAACTYDHTTFFRLTPEDQEYLRKYGISEGDHQ
jgi:hypothetical protein